MPQNATDVAFSTLPPLFSPPQVYCPSPTSAFNLNSCGKKQPQPWSCAGVWTTDPPSPLPFVCSVTGATPDGDLVYTCDTEEVVAEGIPASSCSYTAKACP